MAEIGKVNELTVVKKVDFGVYLDGGDLGEILMPHRYVPRNCRIGDVLEVFIYLDSEDRIIATTERPYAMVGEIALLRVLSITPVGAFLDWGLPKDILAPYSEQKPKMQEGKSYIVRVYLDNSNRIAASSKLDKYLDRDTSSLQEGQEVGLFICNQTDIGYKAIINNSHWGVLHFNDVFQPLTRGQKIKGFIRKIRADNKIDISLHKPGYEKVDEVADTIITALQRQGGFIPVTDKSPPEKIYSLFQISKKTYKKAVGALYKKRMLTIEDNGIRLSNKSNAK